MKPSPTKVASRWKQAAPDLDGMRDSVLYFQDGIDLDEIDFNGHFRWNHTPALGQARRKIHDAMFDYERALRDAHAEEEARLEAERLEAEREAERAVQELAASRFKQLSKVLPSVMERALSGSPSRDRWWIERDITHGRPLGDKNWEARPFGIEDAKIAPKLANQLAKAISQAVPGVYNIDKTNSAYALVLEWPFLRVGINYSIGISPPEEDIFDPDDFDEKEYANYPKKAIYAFTVGLHKSESE